MRSGIIRRTSASLLVGSMWFSAIAIVPVAGFAQQKPANDPAGTDSDAAKTDAKDKDKDKAKPTASPEPQGPLSQKDDPSQIGKRNINKGTDKFFGWLGGSQDKEMAIGRQLAMEVEQQSKMVEDPVITEYVNRVGQNIVLHSDAKIPFTIKVVDNDEVNAFALPGGFFFVNKGLILAADNEAELAGVMAHEIAHVCARHAMENQGKATAMNYGALAGIIFGGAIVGGVLQNAGGIMTGLASLKFSRSAEEEADRLGVQYLYASGYDPTAMSTMFEKLAAQNKKKPGTITKLFSTHPQSIDRRDSSLQLVARFPEKDEYVISTSEFQRVKGHLMSITNARAGVTTDFEQNDDSRPSLKKRQPDAADSGSSDSGGSSSSSADSGPPKLKKRDDPEPKPTPTPSPEL